MQELSKGVELARRYTLQRKLGAGGAAETWLASDRLTRSSVALKILTDARVSAEHFRREWQTGVRLMHAHIARAFEYHDEPEAQFYSLQFIDGPDLGVLSGAPLDHVLPPVAAIADALRYAHDKGVVHRDLKHGNVLLDHNGAPYLVDFGVAAARGEAASGGSVIAASPQQLAGETAQPADDIFALGGLIYELVGGRSPYSSAATADDIRERQPAPLVAADGSPVPAELQQLVAAMLAKEAAARPDAQAVVDALRAMGYRPGTAPAAYVGVSAQPADAVIEVRDTVLPLRREAPGAVPVPADAGRGLSARHVGIALAVLLAILVGVVFVLPDAVEEERVMPAGEPAAAGEPDDGPAAAADGSPRRPPERDERVQARSATEQVLGELLSKMETLESRAVQRWGGLAFKQAQSAYAAGDAAFLDRDYDGAAARYREAIDIVDPLLDEVDEVFARAYDAGLAALEAADTREALRQLELAAAVSPGHAGARAALSRARNLETVLALTDQGLRLENELELEAARQSFADAVDLDPDWEPAQEGLVRVREAIRQRDFDQRMTEGLAALEAQDFVAARAAFRMAKQLRPDSPEPADGLLQVDQGIRLARIAALERQATAEARAEEWETAAETYESILEIDSNLQFAQEGLADARRMAALHAQLDEFIAEPDSLSAPATMARATRLVVDITRMPEIGPRLGDRRDQLSRLLKRAATPLTVTLVSDNVTEVSIYKVGKLGSFESRDVELRPGTYVAVGSRPGYRDVRLEFRVAPELDLDPIVVRCEETI